MAGSADGRSHEQAQAVSKERLARRAEADLKKTQEASSAAMRMRQKSARELGELANSINEIALKAHYGEQS
ncbi:Uncharacterised protein [Pseudescherichia vulneris]|nr:Uncharacterised protein [Pseudescherichia vulneris]